MVLYSVSFIAQFISQVEGSEDDDVDDDDDEVVPIFPEEKFRPFALEKMITVIAFLVEEAKGQSYVSATHARGGVIFHDKTEKYHRHNDVHITLYSNVF